jgi:hypothetical protein
MTFKPLPLKKNGIMTFLSNLGPMGDVNPMLTNVRCMSFF